MNMIPEDIIEYICAFLFGTCSVCSQRKHFNTLTYDVRVQEYRTVFDDEFGFDTILTIPSICDMCFSNLSGLL